MRILACEVGVDIGPQNMQTQFRGGTVMLKTILESIEKSLKVLPV